MEESLHFSASEQTEQQRRDVVKIPVGVSLSQNRPRRCLSATTSPFGQKEPRIQ